MPVLIAIIIRPTSFSVARDKSVTFLLIITQEYKLNLLITDLILEYTVSLALLKDNAILLITLWYNHLL